MEAYLHQGCRSLATEHEEQEWRGHIAMTVDVHLALVSRASNAKELWTVSSEFTSNRATRGDALRKKQRSIVRTLESLQAYFARMHALTDF
jgi:hypothetical protein